MSYGGVTGHIELIWDGMLMGEIAGDSFTFEASFDFCLDPTGIIDNIEELEVEIYPNPSTGLFNVSGAENAKVSIYSITGQQVAEYENFSDGIIDLSAQNNGIYIMKISNESFVSTKRISINR